MGRDIRFLVDDIKEATVQAAREASVRIMNSLAEQGPLWSGEFASSWYAVPVGQSPGGPRRQGGGALYRYDLRNVPKARLQASRPTLFQIINGAPHAGIAMDFETAVFKAESAPIGKVETGRRSQPSRRGAIGSGEVNARRTAPLDWYLTYVNGGGLQSDLALGVSKGFSSTRGRGFA